ncbi:DJ-1/PfpI family protein [Rhizobium helianthi]|uniref:DJ-1/PfpI family protein n=1 Tax=Rhizobium helianthi TaxID=1132695 RepID=A0ABW4M5Z2_9HYPH
MKRIAIALTPDYADWECALLVAVGHAFLGVEVVTASPDGEAVRSMGGFKTVAETAYDRLDAASFDALVIPGGLSWEKGNAPDLNELIHRFRDAGKVVAGICAASSALAASGILDDVRHTGNSLQAHKAHPGYDGEAHYVDQPQAIHDKGIVTAPGTSPFTFAMETLKALDLWSPEIEVELAGFRADTKG